MYKFRNDILYGCQLNKIKNAVYNYSYRLVRIHVRIFIKNRVGYAYHKSRHWVQTNTKYTKRTSTIQL